MILSSGVVPENGQPRAIAYDVMRLFIGPSFLMPRGIDRVDLALARHVFEDNGNENVGVLPTPAGVFALSSNQVRRLLAYVQELWSEVAQPDGDLELQGLLGRIAGRRDSAPPGSPAGRLVLKDQVRRMLRMLGTTRLFPRQLAQRAVPANAVYLNIGQLGLAKPGFFNWLSRRPDITTAMMLHDAIPVDFPHLVGIKAPAYHKQMIRTAAERADCVIFNSEYTRNSVSRVMREFGRDCPPALVRPLPLPSAYLDAGRAIDDLRGVRYFLAVSTIEPRKNFGLLLRVWQRLAATMGAAAPHLVIVGSPGKDAERILAPLASDPAIAGRVHHVAGLSTPALAALLSGAAGMLCPSLAEGFGLPLLEACALGVPAIASDIPAHREVANAKTVLLPADDEPGWARAIAEVPDAVLPRRSDIPDAMTESAYCADIIAFIRSIPPERPD